MSDTPAEEPRHPYPTYPIPAANLDPDRPRTLPRPDKGPSPATPVDSASDLPPIRLWHKESGKAERQIAGYVAPEIKYAVRLVQSVYHQATGQHITDSDVVRTALCDLIERVADTKMFQNLEHVGDIKLLVMEFRSAEAMLKYRTLRESSFKIVSQLTYNLKATLADGEYREAYLMLMQVAQELTDLARVKPRQARKIKEMLDKDDYIQRAMREVAGHEDGGEIAWPDIPGDDEPPGDSE